MLHVLNTILSEFHVERQEPSVDQEFILLYDSVDELTTTDDAELLHRAQALLGLYELVTRSQQRDVFRTPHSPSSRLIVRLAQAVAEQTQQPLYSVLYARALVWPDNRGTWYDFITGSHALPELHRDFIVSSDGEICLLEPLIETAIALLNEGHREQELIWQSNDPRVNAHPLPLNVLQSLCEHVPAFKQFYEHVRMAGNTPLRHLQALREGLREGSTAGTSAAKGKEYDAGSAANEAIVAFSQWWESIRALPLQRQLSALKTGDPKDSSLGELLAIVLRDRSANVTESSDSSTCLFLRGNELEVAINLNKDFLLSFEQLNFTKAHLTPYKDKIISEFQNVALKSDAAGKKAICPLIITGNSQQLPYFAYAVSRLWLDNCMGRVSELSLIEFAGLVPQLSMSQRQQLWGSSFDFFRVEAEQLEFLRSLLLHLEQKVKDNLLLPAEHSHPLTQLDNALLTLLACNYNFLTWVALRYEFLVFTSKPLTELIIKYGLTVDINKARFIIRDSYNFAYYVFIKTEEILQNRQMIRDKLTELGVNTSPESPLLAQIKKGNISACKSLITSNPEYLTHVDWQTGNSSLACAAAQGDKEIARLFIEHGAVLNLKNKEGKTAEEVWPISPSATSFATYIWFIDSLRQLWRAQMAGENPIAQFRKDLAGLAQDDPLLAPERKEALWSLLLAQNNPQDPAGILNRFIFQAFEANKEEVIKRLTAQEQWSLWSQIRCEGGFTLLHLIASNNHTSLYSYVSAIKINDMDNCYNLTPLNCAASNASIDFCRLLIEQGAALDLQTTDGRTALANAARRGQVEICTLLMTNGARLDLKSNEGKTAEEYWPKHSSSQNPFTQFNRAFYHLALFGSDPFRPEHEQLLQLLLKPYTLFLFMALNDDWEKRNLLFYVFSTNKIDLIKRITEQEQWPEWSQARDSSGYTLLHTIAKEGHRSLYPLLHQININDAVNVNQNSPLHLAAAKGDLFFCRLLIDAGVNLNLQSKDGRTALAIAASRGDQPLCEMLLIAGAALNILTHSGYSALMLAANYRQRLVCQLLMSYGADIQLKYENRTAEMLWCPRYTGNPIIDFCNELIDFAQNTERFTLERKKTLFSWLIRSPNLLLQSLNQEHDTFLHLAFAANNSVVIQWLIKHPCWNEYANALSPVKNWSLLATIAAAGQTAHYALVKNLPSSKAQQVLALELSILHERNVFLLLLYLDEVNLDVRFEHNISPLMLAAKKGASALCQSLSKFGVELDVRCDLGYTAMEHAALNGHEQTCRVLLESGAQFQRKKEVINIGMYHLNDISNSMQKLNTALILAAQQGLELCCRVLIQRGASVNYQDHWESSALSQAAKKKHGIVCQLLLEQGANPALTKSCTMTDSYWASVESINPFTVLRKELIDCACNTGNLSERRTAELEALVIKQSGFLNWSLDDEGNTFLYYAFTAKHVRVIEQLVTLPNWKKLALCANVHHSTTLLHVVSEHGHHELYHYLTSIDAYLNKDKKGDTALHVAVMKGNADCCKRLIDMGANPRHKNGEGKTAIDLWITCHPSQDNPFKTYSRTQQLERIKAQILELLDREHPFALLDGLYQKIQDAQFGLTPSNAQKAEHVLNDILSQWEYSRFEGRKTQRFFSQKHSLHYLSEQLICEIKELVSPEKEEFQNRIYTHDPSKC